MDWLYILIIIVLAVAAGAGFFLSFRQREKSLISEKQREAFIKTSNQYLIFWKADLSHISVNDKFRNKLTEMGKSVNANLLLSFFDSEKTYETFNPTTLAVNALRDSWTDSVVTSSDGEVCYIKWQNEVVEIKSPVPLLISVGTDETELRYLKNELYEQRQKNYISEENFETAMESAEIGIIFISAAELPNIKLSENGIKMLGLTGQRDLTLQDLESKVYGVDLNNYQIKLKNLLSGISDTLEIEVKMQTEDNDYHNFMLKWRSIKDEFGNLTRVTGALTDVTFQRERYHLYDAASLIDPLSGLYNRKGFMEKGAGLLKRIREFDANAVMLSIKVERMLKINSLFGNEMWERLIKCYAEGFTKLSGEHAVIGRIGNDDFAVLKDYEKKQDVERLAKELLIFLENCCDDIILPLNLKEQVRFDAGICYYDGNDDVQTLFYKANIMLFASKDIGVVTCHYYDDEIEKKIHERELIEYEISAALRHNEFELYYQPKISFKTGEILGAEALIRWNHPKRGLIQPFEFVPIAEDIGHIMKIDEWGIKQACQQNKYWQKKGYKHIKVSVNMSKVLLYNANVVDMLARVLAETKLDPKFLEVEVTETMAVQDINYTILVLQDIKRLGVSISMDDFGTGYSSLASIKQLPIDVLKVDRSLICDITENPASANITKAIIDMGKAMNFHIVTEGVETQEQWDILQELGCDEAQGYFHGKPLTTAELERQFFM